MTYYFDSVLTVCSYYFISFLGNRAQGEKKYVTIDPGQVVLMSYSEYQQNGTMVGSGSLLSQREYYHKCGITAAHEKYLK